MKIEDVENAEDLWSILLEDAVKNGDEYITMPSSAMSEEVVVALARRLDISVSVRVMNTFSP
jgi:hypothetical protein